MSNHEETKRQINVSDLNLKEKGELLVKYLGKNPIVTGDLTANLQATNDKEVATEYLEFTKDSFSMSSDDRAEVTLETAKKNPFLEKFLECGQRVKANKKGDIIEYLEDHKDESGKITCKKGEQLFINYDHYIQYVAQAKGYSVQEVEQQHCLKEEKFKEMMLLIKSGKHQVYKNYPHFYTEVCMGRLAGGFQPEIKKCVAVGQRFHIWLAGGASAVFNENDCLITNSCASFGFSGRLIKHPK